MALQVGLGKIDAVEVGLDFGLCELRDGGGVRASGDCGGDGVNVIASGRVEGDFFDTKS